MLNSSPATGRAKCLHGIWYPIPKRVLSAELIRTVYSVYPVGISISLLVKVPVVPLGLFPLSANFVFSSSLDVLLLGVVKDEELPSLAAITFISIVSLSFEGSKVTL